MCLDRPTAVRVHTTLPQTSHWPSTLGSRSATFAAATIFAGLVATALQLAWNPPAHTYLEYVPIGTVCGLLVWDRLFPFWAEGRRSALCDAAVMMLGLMRVFVPPLPFMSGHTLVAAYAALTARGWPLRVIASAVVAYVLYDKLLASPGWLSMLSGLAGASMIAAVRHRLG